MRGSQRLVRSIFFFTLSVLVLGDLGNNFMYRLSISYQVNISQQVYAENERNCVVREGEGDPAQGEKAERITRGASLTFIF